MKKRGKKATSTFVEKRSLSDESTPAIYPVAPSNIISLNKTNPTIDGFDKCKYMPSEFYRRDNQKKINEIIKEAWTSPDVRPSTNAVNTLGMFYEEARKAYTVIQGKKIDVVDKKCKPMFDIGMLLLASLCVRAAKTKSKKKGENAHDSMVSVD